MVGKIDGVGEGERSKDGDVDSIGEGERGRGEEGRKKRGGLEIVVG